MVSRFKFLDYLGNPAQPENVGRLQQFLIVVAEDAAVAAQRFAEADKERAQ